MFSDLEKFIISTVREGVVAKTKIINLQGNMIQIINIASWFVSTVECERKEYSKDVQVKQ